MSLINSILGQKVILLLVGGTLLIFLVAVGINFVVAIRAAAKKRAKRKAAERAHKLAVKKARARAKAAQLAALETNVEKVEVEQPDPTLADELGEAAVLVITDAQAALIAELTAPNVTMAGPTANAPVGAAILPSMPVQALGGAPADQSKKETDKASEIQAMLADVFEDDESDGRYELLLGDTESIPADDLLEQINRIARQLGTNDAPKDDIERKESKAS